MKECSRSHLCRQLQKIYIPKLQILLSGLFFFPNFSNVLVIRRASVHQKAPLRSSQHGEELSKGKETCVQLHTLIVVEGLLFCTVWRRNKKNQPNSPKFPSWNYLKKAPPEDLRNVPNIINLMAIKDL